MQYSNVIRAAAALTLLGGGFGIKLPRRKYRGDYCIQCEKDLPPGRFGRKCPKCRNIEVSGEHLNYETEIKTKTKTG